MRTMMFQAQLTARVWLRVGAAVSLAALLAGCSAGPLDTRAGYDASDDGSADAQPAMASLPAAAGAPVAVLQSQVHGVLTQRIVLHGDPNTVGENAIVVRINVDKGPTDIDGPVGLPTRGKIATELEENFAGVDMGVAQSFMRNSFGPFGYAVGHPRTGETCLYAWQFAVWKPALIGAGPTGAPSLPTQPTSVRVRLCRTTLGEAEMVELLKDLQVYPPHSRLAYMDPAYTADTHSGDSLGAAGVGSFMAPDAAAAPERHKKHKHRLARHRHHHMREARAEAEDAPPAADAAPLLRGEFAVPAPPSSAATTAAPTSANPLLAPLAAQPAARADDLPLPGRPTAAPPSANSGPVRSSIPLPN